MVFAPHGFNYPPFSAWVYWTKGVLFHAVEPHPPAIPVPPALRAAFERRGLPQTVAFRTINTRLTWAVDALPSFAFDVLLAFGVLALVRVLRGAGPDDVAGPAALALVLLSPAVFLDGGFWGQSDSWITSMLVWCLVWWLRERWVLAGAAYGLALVTKPQAILFAPVLAYAFLALRFRPGGSWARMARALWAVPAAVAVVGLVAAPFMAHDARAGAGAWRWFQRSWVGTIGSDEYAYTTLNAFNVWWLDLVRQRPATTTGGACSTPGRPRCSGSRRTRPARCCSGSRSPSAPSSAHGAFAGATHPAWRSRSSCSSRRSSCRRGCTSGTSTTACRSPRRSRAIAGPGGRCGRS
jgi:hypothetical protein